MPRRDRSRCGGRARNSWRTVAPCAGRMGGVYSRKSLIRFHHCPQARVGFAAGGWTGVRGSAMLVVCQPVAGSRLANGPKGAAYCLQQARSRRATALSPGDSRQTLDRQRRDFPVCFEIPLISMPFGHSLRSHHKTSKCNGPSTDSLRIGCGQRLTGCRTLHGHERARRGRVSWRCRCA